MQNYGMLLLAIYLIVTGLKMVLSFSFPFDAMVLGVLAVVAGVLLIMKK
jgi:hypothetical protein